MKLLRQGDKEPDGKGPIHSAQWLLAGHNVFDENYDPGLVDGKFGKQTADACVRAKTALGYPNNALEATFGATLRDYLTGKVELPKPYLARRNKRHGEGAAGKYIYPAEERVQLIGFPGGGTHSFTVEPNNWQSDNAWDFGFPTGTPLLAVADGVIGDRIGPISDDPKSRFGGLRCYLKTADNEFYYAHLSSFAPGTKAGAQVRQGDVIGLSGSASGVDHLHLGVLDWRSFQPVAEGVAAPAPPAPAPPAPAPAPAPSVPSPAAPRVPGAKIVLGRGALGEHVRQLQARLAELGFDPKGIDGAFGPGTEKAVGAFRKKQGLGAGGEVDAATWQAAMERPVPTLQERALAVTAAFEGHGFDLAAGNYDGAGLTWGIIGFTLQHGSVSALILEAHTQDPSLVQQAFGKNADELLTIMRAPRPRQLAWADSISIGARKTGVREPWKGCFRRFGQLAAVQALQVARVQSAYWDPARRTAKELGLKTELGLALCFDIHVQNGSVRPSAREQIRREVAENPIHKERELRVIVANAVADASRPQYREDVRSRKLTLATGAGKVHGATYVLRNWGLDATRAS
jgi:murein DD-endopeptidase MepM/ murein hydrolase activator NlpD